MAFIRFLKVRGHLRQKFIGGDSNIYSKSQFLPDSFPDFIGHLHGTAKEMDSAGHVQENLVDTEFLMVRRIFLQKIHHAAGAFNVKIKPGRDNHQIRALTQGLNQGLTCGDSILLGQRRLGQHDSVAGLGVPSNRRSNRSQIQGLRVFRKPVHTFPA